MDSKTLVNEQIDAAGELVEQLDKYMPVKVAFWLKPADIESWLLYIAAERVAQDGVALGNREIVRICQQINSPYLDIFRVRLIPADDPLTQSVLLIHQLYPDRLPMRYGGATLGGTSIEGAYLYPVPATAGNP